MQQTTNFPPNTQAFAYRFNMRYKHMAYPNEGMCRIEMYKSNGDVLIVATELRDNPGPSVINAAEAIYDKLAKAYDLTPGTSTFVTRFNNDSLSLFGERADHTLVTLNVNNDERCKYGVNFQNIREIKVLEMIAHHRENGSYTEITDIDGVL